MTTSNSRLELEAKIDSMEKSLRSLSYVCFCRHGAECSACRRGRVLTKQIGELHEELESL